MKEATLEQAVKIKKELDSERKRRESLEEMICQTLAPDMIDGMRFRIVAKSKDSIYEESEYINPETAKTALLMEIDDAMNKIMSLEKKLDEMH